MDPFPEAVIVAAPAVIPVANPLELIVAMPVFDERHVTVVVMSGCSGPNRFPLP